MFWEMVCFASHTNLRTTRNMNLFILTLAIMLLLVRMRIPVNSSLFQEQAQVVFGVTSRGLQCYSNEITSGADNFCQPLVMEQGTDCCVTPWSQHAFPGFALCSAAIFQEDLWGFQVPLDEEWRSKGQRVQWWPMAPPGTGDGKAHRRLSQGWVQRHCSASHTAQKSTAWRLLQGQAGKPRGQVQVWIEGTGDQMQTQLLCNCSLKSAPAFLLVSPVSPPSFSAENSISQLPSFPCPCLRAGVCQGCRGQGSTKDHRSNQTDLRELFKGLQELQTGCCNGFTTLFNNSEVSEKCMYSPAIQEPLITMSLKWIIRACTVSPKHWPCLWCVRLGDSDGAFWCC